MRSILALIGQEAAFLRVLHQGGPEGTDRAPQGWVQGPTRRRYVRCTHPTTPPPCRGLRARFAGWACSSSKVAGYPV